MGTMPTNVAVRQPAEIVIVDSRTSRDFDAPFPVIPADKRPVERFLTAERARRGFRPAPKPLSRNAGLVLRVGAALFLLMAAAQVWFAATSVHP